LLIGTRKASIEQATAIAMSWSDAAMNVASERRELALIQA